MNRLCHAFRESGTVYLHMHTQLLMLKTYNQTGMRHTCSQPQLSLMMVPDNVPHSSGLHAEGDCADSGRHGAVVSVAGGGA